MSAQGRAVPGQDTGTGVRVRRATQEDLEAVARIESRARRGTDRDQLVLALTDPERVVLVVNATNVASLALHEGAGFREVARAASFHTIRFTGGSGVLLRAELGAGRA
ncbi:hypothetical protein [Oerskovia rustica]|uniref:GNAT family N-acetyltransferase n=1 Tax=Oerskovia rustica TaxID=2762237 RepID=A0ABR8RQD1_9CELL|nr:hypothetical protein [Oerskovia rustica]MBD7949872.1 hypothetical protein [Oerskovia rustica]